MKKKNKFDISSFEQMSASGNGTLIGGFSSTADSGNVAMVANRNTNCPITNNCNGGNCVRGCGSIQ